MLELRTGDAHLSVDPSDGGTITSLRVGDLELLLPREPHSLRGGCYPMVPYAGRVRRGQFTHAGRSHALPIRMPPHAIHGTVQGRTWQAVDDTTLKIDLGPDWPFAGEAVQRFSLDSRGLDIELELRAERTPFPASIGLHPWFKRDIGRGEPLCLEFEARRMYRRDADGIPDGTTTPPTPPPWDDCFTALVHPPRLRWPGALELTVRSDASHCVVYDEPEDAICVEPMSGPPDALNIEPRIVGPRTPLRLQTRLEWVVA